VHLVVKGKLKPIILFISVTQKTKIITSNYLGVQMDQELQAFLSDLLDQVGLLPRAQCMNIIYHQTQ